MSNIGVNSKRSSVLKNSTEQNKTIILNHELNTNVNKSENNRNTKAYNTKQLKNSKILDTSSDLEILSNDLEKLENNNHNQEENKNIKKTKKVTFSDVLENDKNIIIDKDKSILKKTSTKNVDNLDTNEPDDIKIKSKIENSIKLIENLFFINDNKKLNELKDLLETNNSELKNVPENLKELLSALNKKSTDKVMQISKKILLEINPNQQFEEKNINFLLGKLNLEVNKLFSNPNSQIYNIVISVKKSELYKLLDSKKNLKDKVVYLTDKINEYDKKIDKSNNEINKITDDISKIKNKAIVREYLHLESILSINNKETIEKKNLIEDIYKNHFTKDEIEKIKILKENLKAYISEVESNLFSKKIELINNDLDSFYSKAPPTLKQVEVELDNLQTNKEEIEKKIQEIEKNKDCEQFNNKIANLRDIKGDILYNSRERDFLDNTRNDFLDKYLPKIPMRSGLDLDTFISNFKKSTKNFWFFNKGKISNVHKSLDNYKKDLKEYEINKKNLNIYNTSLLKKGNLSELQNKYNISLNKLKESINKIESEAEKYLSEKPKSFKSAFVQEIEIGIKSLKKEIDNENVNLELEEFNYTVENRINDLRTDFNYNNKKHEEFNNKAFIDRVDDIKTLKNKLESGNISLSEIINEPAFEMIKAQKQKTNDLIFLSIQTENKLFPQVLTSIKNKNKDNNSLANKFLTSINDFDKIYNDKNSILIKKLNYEIKRMNIAEITNIFDEIAKIKSELTKNYNESDKIKNFEFIHNSFNSRRVLVDNLEFNFINKILNSNLDDISKNPEIEKIIKDKIIKNIIIGKNNDKDFIDLILGININYIDSSKVYDFASDYIKSNDIINFIYAIKENFDLGKDFFTTHFDKLPKSYYELVSCSQLFLGELGQTNNEKFKTTQHIFIRDIYKNINNNLGIKISTIASIDELLRQRDSIRYSNTDSIVDLSKALDNEEKMVLIHKLKQRAINDKSLIISELENILGKEFKSDKYHIGVFEAIVDYVHT